MVFRKNQRQHEAMPRNELRHSLKSDLQLAGKAKPFRTECGKAACIEARPSDL